MPEGEKGTINLPHLRHQFVDVVDTTRLVPAADDLRFLLGKGYPWEASLTLVGNRYNLPWAARQILRRGVAEPAVAAKRRMKLRPLRDVSGRPLALDGHNVVITLECALRGLPVTAADDGFIRDIGHISHRYQPSSLTDQVLQRLSEYLAGHGVVSVFVWYDSPMSRSGELAAATRKIMQACHLDGDALAVPVPEARLLEWQGVIGSSDTFLIDRREQVADVAGEIIREMPGVEIIDLSSEQPEKQELPGKLK
jgi:hypothetical protein